LSKDDKAEPVLEQARMFLQPLNCWLL